MPSFTVTVEDQEIQTLLNRLAEKLGDLRPALQAIGDEIVERAKARFAVSQGPDGTPWKENAPSTLAAWMGKGGKNLRKKSGAWNAAGLRRLTSKRPLIGESGDLRRQIGAVATASEVTVRASTVYAAIHQFGGKAGRGHKVTIPARPFLPVHADGTLYPQDREAIIAAIKELLASD
jgi:phage virion morphogenesis protein